MYMVLHTLQGGFQREVLLNAENVVYFKDIESGDQAHKTWVCLSGADELYVTETLAQIMALLSGDDDALSGDDDSGS
jgi:hypothetical protein